MDPPKGLMLVKKKYKEKRKDPNLEPLFEIEENKLMPQKKQTHVLGSKFDLKEKDGPKKTPFRILQH